MAKGTKDEKNVCVCVHNMGMYGNTYRGHLVILCSPHNFPSSCQSLDCYSVADNLIPHQPASVLDSIIMYLLYS